MIKGTIQQEDLTLGNIYTSNIGATKYVKQILIDIKGEINRNTVIVKYFHTPLTSMDTSSSQKNKETVALNDTLDKMHLIAIYRAFHLKAAEYTYFSSEQGTFSRIDHMLGHKTSLHKFKSEIISSITLTIMIQN